MLKFGLALTAAVAAALVMSVPAAAGPFYASTGYGWNTDSEDVPFVSEDSGQAGSIALGTHVDGVDGLRFELEAAYRTHDSSVFGFIPLEHDTTTVIANVAYDFNDLNIGPAVPYALVGAGMAHTELTVGGIAPLTIENDGFAWQLGGGFNVPISETGIKLGLEYKYTDTPELAVFGFELDGGSNHSIMAKATVALN